ncbi:MAG: hypothetical protein JKX71_07500 [Amylibacter sp.]|nr:hypothetical protein [Amylibacter sp.]
MTKIKSQNFTINFMTNSKPKGVSGRVQNYAPTGKQVGEKNFIAKFREGANKVAIRDKEGIAKLAKL